MADDDQDTPMTEEHENADSSSGSSSESEEEEQQVEWLATTRAKRSTAGNRLHSLLQAEEPDDDLELLFAEDDDDAGFEEEEAAQSDVQMDSSDDDEDQGPVAGADDMEGEQELQKQAKAERVAKKRKGNNGIPKIFKRVKIDPTAPQAQAPRPKKKSERASWLPTAEDAPTRASARGTTQKSKEQLHEQMKDREKRRLKQLANMEKAAARKEAMRKPAMTQEDRLKEAARVEKQNSKSLSRWEEAELIREEERRAKLAALSDRKLQGPVITWWSGLGEYIGGNLKKVGKILTLEDPKEKSSKKRKASEMETAIITPDSVQPANTPLPRDSTERADPAASKTDGKEPTKTPPVKSEEGIRDEIVVIPKPSPTPPVPVNVPVPTPSPVAIPKQYPAPPPFSLAPPNGPAPSSFLAPPPMFNPPLPPPPKQIQQPPVQRQPSPKTQMSPFTFNPAPVAPRLPTPPPPVHEKTVRNYLILSNFDETAIKDKNVQTQILFNRRFTKVQKTTATSCAITGYPAKFRDPITGLAYCNAYAYKEIQKLRRGEYKWSSLLGAYIGQGTYAARGVPVRFLNANAGKEGEKKDGEKKEDEKSIEDGTEKGADKSSGTVLKKEASPVTISTPVSAPTPTPTPPAPSAPVPPT